MSWRLNSPTASSGAFLILSEIGFSKSAPFSPISTTRCLFHLTSRARGSQELDGQFDQDVWIQAREIRNVMAYINDYVGVPNESGCNATAVNMLYNRLYVHRRSARVFFPVVGAWANCEQWSAAFHTVFGPGKSPHEYYPPMTSCIK
jgi:hypothetical protein